MYSINLSTGVNLHVYRTIFFSCSSFPARECYFSFIVRLCTILLSRPLHSLSSPRCAKRKRLTLINQRLPTHLFHPVRDADNAILAQSSRIIMRCPHTGTINVTVCKTFFRYTRSFPFCFVGKKLHFAYCTAFLPRALREVLIAQSTNQS